MEYDVIIIGAGQAGLSVAMSLRKKGFLGSILLIGNEKLLPYQRPPLSKGFIAGEIDKERLKLKSSGYYLKNNIKVILNNPVNCINNKNKSVTLKNKNQYKYKKLVISTGSKVKKLSNLSSTDNLYYLRTVSDAIKVKSMLKKSKELVIIGGGYIGLEVAASARKKGVQVTVIESENRLMKRSASPVISKFLIEKHKRKGTKFILNTFVDDITIDNNQQRVLLSNGNTVNGDAFLVGIGIEPIIDLAIKSKIKCSNGILVNNLGQTSDPNIYSAGDCTNFPSCHYNKRLRLESVHNAVEQGKTVANTILGNNNPYEQIPWFWSDQYNIKLQTAGIFGNENNLVIRGNTQAEKFTVYFFKKNQLVAIESINDLKAFLLGRKLISLKAKIPPEIIRNENINLKSWYENSFT